MSYQILSQVLVGLLWCARKGEQRLAQNLASHSSSGRFVFHLEARQSLNLAAVEMEIGSC